MSQHLSGRFSVGMGHKDNLLFGIFNCAAHIFDDSVKGILLALGFCAGKIDAIFYLWYHNTQIKSTNILHFSTKDNAIL